MDIREIFGGGQQQREVAQLITQHERNLESLEDQRMDFNYLVKNSGDPIHKSIFLRQIEQVIMINQHMRKEILELDYIAKRQDVGRLEKLPKTSRGIQISGEIHDLLVELGQLELGI